MKTVPEISAKTFAAFSCYQMFYDCTGLNYIKCLATDLSAETSTEYWVYDISSEGTFVKAAGMTGWITGRHGIPEKWTVREE